MRFSLAKGGITVKGVQVVARALKNFARKSVKGTQRGLLVWGEETKTLAMKEVPVKDGTLRGSGDVEEKMIGGSPAVEISFGGESPAGAYAIPVHERPFKGHKYLERPALANAKNIIPTVGREVRAETGMK